jgi:hypothetical protein
MDYVREPERRIPVVADADVLVCGGGIAGVAAAVCAAREGAHVMLIERYGFFGGLATGSLVITTPPLNNGINNEIRARLENRETYVPTKDPGDDPATESLIGYDPEILKYELMRMLREARVRVLLHTYIARSLYDGRLLTGVVIENKAGRQCVKAKMFVDATGDGDVAASANAPFEMAETPLPMTMMFNMVDVDTDRAIGQLGHWGNLRRVFEEAIKSGRLEYELGLYSKGYAPGVYAATLCYPGELNVWSGSLYGKNGLNPDELTEAEFITREHVMRMADFLRANVAGFEKSRIEYTSTQVGVRETRRVLGDICPTLEQVKTIVFDDTVAKPYSHMGMRVPYRSLVPIGLDNLLVAGRCISASQDAMVQLRLIPPCFVTGQAAGTAAALALSQRRAPRDLDIGLLRKRLSDQGMSF